MKKILFVCTGNTCRSSMAEGLMKKLLKDAKLNNDISMPKYKVESRGLFVLEGDSANVKAISVMEDTYEVDISRHKAKQLNKDDVENSFLILTMTQEHKQGILYKWPDAAGKVFTLKEFAEESLSRYDFAEIGYTTEYNISDPYGGSIDEYRFVAAEIFEALGKIVNKLKLD